ncbi:recombinase family protein [Blastococcus goldschmidtiae]|uniref:Recombinase family protein n=1 Tax=Blastococcus goldschmidtiae TaxID=3075546 RepID=A0ABU2K985_9ACTN|nr:recombinase family protein [Blastococcus sp. DSM 46792]MDT0276708.1 recombinase family protein [Blastococcus sp. DSM 46792]
MRLVAYERVSTNVQAERGFGLDVQHAQVLEWAEANGHDVVLVCRDEGVSGATDAADRAGLACALAAIPSDADVIVVARLDRLARSLTVQEAILAAIWRDGGHVVAMDQGEVQRDDPDDPMRTAMRQMAGVFAELDRRLIIKRLRDGRRAKAAQGGKAVGRYPFGWCKDGEVAREQRVLDAMRDLRGDGHSWREVADRLNAGGPVYRPRKADTWTTAGLAKVGRRAGVA